MNSDPCYRVARMSRVQSRPMPRRVAALVALALLGAAAANVVYLASEPLAGLVAGEAVARAVATAAAGAAALVAGVVMTRSLPRVLLVASAVLLLAVVGLPPALAVGAPLLLALLSGLAKDVAEVTQDLPGVRARLLVLVAVGLAGPPTIALAHLFA